MEKIARFLRENWLTLSFMMVLLVAFVALRSEPSEIGSPQEFVASLSAGEPTVVYFYSNT